MHRFTLQFDNNNLEKQYFSDQYQEMLNFYFWACILGSLSAITIFIMEFIVPFGFENLAYGLFLIPFAFYMSYNFLRKHPSHYNLILALINIALGFMIYFLLYVFANSKVLFLAGQTVAMIQYSMLLGSNVIINIIILLINSLGLMMMCTVIQEFLNCLQLMFILALILVIKSVWSQEKLKRQFFLLKSQNSFLQSTLDNVFELKIIHCRFDSQLNGFVLINANKQAQKIIKNQNEFLQFIRQYKLMNQYFTQDNFIDILFDKEKNQKLNLEQLMLRAKKKQITELSTQITSTSLQNFYRISFYQQICNEESFIILLLQEDTESRQILKLRKNNQRYKFIQQFVTEYFSYAKQSLFNLKYILSQQLIDQNRLMYLLKKSQQNLYQSLHGYYNIQLYLERSNFGKIMKFDISKLQQDILKMWGIYNQKQDIQIYTKKCSIECETNYAMLLQIMLNIFVQTIGQEDYDEIFFNIYTSNMNKVQLVNFSIIFKFENNQFKKFQTTDQIYLNKILERVNKKLYKIVCLSKEQRVTIKPNCYTVELDVIQNLVDFKTSLETINYI